MAELFSKSILHFPAEIYLKRCVWELFPLPVCALDQSQIVAMQFFRVGLVLVTVRTQAYREELLTSQFMFEDVVTPVSPADRVAKVVYVRDLSSSPFLAKSILSSLCITESSPPSALAPALF